MKDLYSKLRTPTIKPAAAISSVLTLSLLAVGVTYASRIDQTPRSTIHKTATTTLITLPPIAPASTATNTNPPPSEPIDNQSSVDKTVNSTNAAGSATTEVSINGQNLTPPDDGSTLTKVIASPDGSTTTVVSVSGNHQSTTGTSGQSTTTSRTSVHTSTNSHSRFTATDSSP